LRKVDLEFLLNMDYFFILIEVLIETIKSLGVDIVGCSLLLPSV